MQPKKWRGRSALAQISLSTSRLSSSLPPFLFACPSSGLQDSLWDDKDSYEMTEAQADDSNDELDEEEEDWDGGLDEDLRRREEDGFDGCAGGSERRSALLLFC